MNDVKKYHFEDYVERANAAGSVEALFKVFVDTVKQHGLDRAIFSLSTEHGDIDTPAQLGLIHNYPRDWMKYYFEKGFDRIDPVLIHAATKSACSSGRKSRAFWISARNSGSASIWARRPDCTTGWGS